MLRIKLPGSLKFKMGLLVVLVLIAIGVLVKTGMDNREPKVEDKKTEEAVIESPKEENPKEEEKKVEEPVNQEEENLYNDALNTFNNGNYNDTITKADAIIAKFPNSYKAYNIRGFAKAFNVSFDAGMKDIDKGLELKSDYWYGRYAKAFNYELYDKFDESLKWYDKSLEIQEYKWTYYGKASIYGRRGDVANTVDNLKKAIEVEKKENSAESQIKKEAKTEKDFDPVRGKAEFEAVIK